jgi:hypothetical protein
MIASGVAAADAYYLGHHQDGAVLFLLSDPRLRSLLKPSVLRMNTVFMTFISGWTVPSHQRTFAAYAEAKGCRVQVTDARVDCVDPTGERLSGDFDARGRLVCLNINAGPEPGAS